MNSHLNKKSCWYKFNIKDVIVIFILLIPGLVFLSTTGDISVYFRFNVLDGQLLYVISKLVALYALLLIWLQISLGMLGQQGREKLGLLIGSKFHRNLGLSILVSIILHVVLFVTAVSIRNGHFAYKLLLPNLFGPYYPFMLSLGVLALWLILFAVMYISISKKESKMYKWGHRATLPAFVLILIHSYTIGTESRAGLMMYFYMLMTVTFLIILTYRIISGFANRHQKVSI